MPGWNDLSAVREILVWMGAVAWLFLAALAFFELLAHRKTKNEKAFEAAGIASFVIFVLLDLGTFIYGIRHDELALQEIAVSNGEAKVAIARAADANAKAAAANDDAEGLRKQNLLLQKQLEAERSQRLNLAKDVAPRYFPYAAVWPRLKPFAGTKFVIWFVQDPEAERLARLIEEALGTAKWVSASRLMIEENINAYDEGVIVEVPYQHPWPPLSGSALDEQNKTNEAAHTLCRILTEYNIGPLLSAADLPSGTVRIRVHFKPDPKSTRAMIEEFRAIEQLK